jgi:hypothetical protein
MSAMYALRVVEQLIEGLCGDGKMETRYRDFGKMIKKNEDLDLKRLSSPLINFEIDRLLEIRTNIDTEGAQPTRMQIVRILLAMHSSLSAYIASGKAFDSVSIVALPFDDNAKDKPPETVK